MSDDRYGRRARGEFLVRVLRAWNDRSGRPRSESAGLGLGPFERDQRGADGAGVFAERGGHDRYRGPVLAGEHELGERRSDRSHHDLARLDESTSDDGDLGVQDVDEVGDAEGGPPAEVAEHRDRLGITLHRGTRDVFAPHVVDVAAGELDETVTTTGLGGLARQPGESAS